MRHDWSSGISSIHRRHDHELCDQPENASSLTTTDKSSTVGILPWVKTTGSETPPVPKRPSQLIEDYPQSVLLSPQNAITNAHEHVRHKPAPPVLRARKRLSGHDRSQQREMSPQERNWWSSPYLRMLSTPIRQCYLTKCYLPSDLLIRLVPMRLPPTFRLAQKDLTHAIVPDGLLNSKYQARKPGRAFYVVCRKDAFGALRHPKMYRRLNAAPSGRLADHISHLLRVRVLQELEILARGAKRALTDKRRPQDPDLLRRLTRTEWEDVKTTNVLRYPGALAVLIIPPVNRDPTTKSRPETADALSTKPSPTPTRAFKPPPPLSVLHPSADPVQNRIPTHEIVTHESSTDTYWEQERERRAGIEARAKRAALPAIDSLIETMESIKPAPPSSLQIEEQGEIDVQPHAEEQIPLYNGIALFPDRAQRAYAHKLLTRILTLESTRRGLQPDLRPKKKSRREIKSSHAFLLCADPPVDAAALGVALWRLRMWESGGDKIGDHLERWPWTKDLSL
ncbi:unnamed protein product [Mycena citricolor]|uniref:Uncharacterized protein n=1 Tax=Mycena citricolor TaxID=2018698 RepID=A0AAD2K3J7_9AGAR|nr:unnamed protein product [Mycena citricolor]